MRTLRARLILSHILPLLLVIPLIGAALVYLLETQVLLSDLSQRLSAEAQLIAAAVNPDPEIWEDLEQAKVFITEVSQGVPDWILLIDQRGNLIIAGRAGGVDLTGRSLDPEGIAAALSGLPSVQVSYGVFQQDVQVFVPVKDLNQKLVGIIGLTGTIEGIAEQFGRFRRYILFILLVEFGIGSLIGLLLAVNLERPIRQVSEAVVEIAHGERTMPVPETGPEEIQDLSTAVNDLSRQLREMEEVRRSMLANIVHEISRPLAAVMSAVHVLLQEPGNDPEIRRELLLGVENEVSRMQPLLDDLAQLHGQVLGSVELKLQTVSINEWLPPILLPWRTAALDRGIEWQVDLAKDLPAIQIDPDRMAQVLGNLLSNAIKYTPNEGKIRVAAGSDENEVWIRVSDTGPGISPEEQEQVFEPFFRSQKQHRFPQGLGLGLTIARDLVTAHRGRLELTSAFGEGSQFTVYIPIEN